MIDKIVSVAFESAYTAIFEVGSVMAVLMLLFGMLDFRYGDKLRQIIEKRRLDKPWVMTGLSLIPVDGTLLFQYSIYRRKSIRFGSLLSGIIGIGEEATYLILSYQPLAWLTIAGIKLLLSAVFGSICNKIPALNQAAERWRQDDLIKSDSPEAKEADVNFHELPDKFRHKMHHFRYHQLGKAFWIFFAVAFILQMVLLVFDNIGWFDPADLEALGIPFVSWLSMLALFIVVIYRLIVRLTTREFGKIFEHEFEDTGDAVGDLAETCASVILLIFLLTFVVQSFLSVIGSEALTRFFAGRGLLAVLIGALVGLIPGTGASLAFTTLYFGLAGTSGAMPFAALAACSIALIGDSQFIGRKQLPKSQFVAHAIAFVIALLTGLAILGIEQLI
ncbi:MAG: putative manganese transporter [Clostridiaceae bacterium]|nr:putative manganese transporter [Clostridiaceae bacterium]